MVREGCVHIHNRFIFVCFGSFHIFYLNPQLIFVVFTSLILQNVYTLLYESEVLYHIFIKIFKLASQHHKKSEDVQTELHFIWREFDVYMLHKVLEWSIEYYQRSMLKFVW